MMMSPANDMVDNEVVKDLEVEESPSIRFSPPAYIQRYNKVREELRDRITKGDATPKTIMEVGCAEFGMHPHLKNLDQVERIIYVDKDTNLLEEMKYRLKPLPYESLVPRESPLEVQVFAGCVTETDERIMNCKPDLYAIIGIEILEHLDEDIEVEFIRTLFKEYAPPLIILTTPNSDFNPILGLEHGHFRHWDHRFELSRKEFEDWCIAVCQLFPSYTFTIEGVCEGPEGTREKVGCLSQMAVFERSHKLAEHCENPRNGEYLTGISDISATELVVTGPHKYKLLEEIKYPWKTRPPLHLRFFNEFQYAVNTVILCTDKLEELWASGESQVIESGQYFVNRCKHFPDADLITINNARLWLEAEGYSCLEDQNCENFKVIIPIPASQACDSDDCEDHTSSAGNEILLEDGDDEWD